MSAATELVDRSERNRAQGTVKFVTFPTGAISMHRTAITLRFRWPINKFEGEVQSFLEYFGYRDKNTTISNNWKCHACLRPGLKRQSGACRTSKSGKPQH